MSQNLAVGVQVHYVAGMRPLCNVRTADIAKVYAAIGVTLEFTEGADLPPQPAIPRFYRRALCGVMAPDSCTGGDPTAPLNAPAHLIVGDILEGRTLGALIHRQRGACVVCARSPGLPSDASRDDVLFQVCVHEIGHLLNFLHDSPEPYSTVMCQEGDRFGPCRTAWIDAGDAGVDPGLPSYPFSRESKAWLVTSSEAECEPWGEDFRDLGFLGPLDRARNAATFDLILDSADLQVGDGIAYEVRIRASKAKGLVVPDGLGPEHGGVVLLVRRPDGSQYVHKPHHLLCEARGRRLKAGGKAVYSGLLTHGPGGPLLPVPGTYDIEARCPWLGGPTRHARIEVRENPALERRPALHRFVADGSGGSISVRKECEGLLASRTRGGGSLLHLAAYRVATESVHPPTVRRSLEAALRPEAPRLLRHQAILLWVHLARDDDGERRRVERYVERNFGDAERDRRLRTSLEAMGR